MIDLLKKLQEFVKIVELRKALEDKFVDPEARREFRRQRQQFAGTDPLEGQITPQKGVSDVGIETRRGDTRQVGATSHGYGRVHMDPEQHKQFAKDIHRALLSSFKSQPKPDLPKTEKAEQGVHEPVSGKTGESVAGYYTRYPKRVKDPDVTRHAPRMASQIHQEILKELKNMPKLNLPKSEVEDGDPLEKASREKGVNKPYAPGLGAAGISGQGYTVRGAMRTISPEGNKGQTFRQPQGGPNYDRELARDKAKKIFNELKNMPKPNLPKTEKAEKKVLIRPDIVSEPYTFEEEVKVVNRPKVVNGPNMMNVRKTEPLKKPYASEAQRRWAHTEAGNKALGGEKAVEHWDKESKGKHLPEKVKKAGMNVTDQHDEQDMGRYVEDVHMSEGKQEQKYHIHDGSMRITKDPMTLKDITAAHGPVQKLESMGFRLIPHQPKPATPTVLRRSE